MSSVLTSLAVTVTEGPYGSLPSLKLRDSWRPTGPTAAGFQCHSDRDRRPQTQTQTANLSH